MKTRKLLSILAVSLAGLLGCKAKETQVKKYPALEREQWGEFYTLMETPKIGAYQMTDKVFRAVKSKILPEYQERACSEMDSNADHFVSDHECRQYFR